MRGLVTEVLKTKYFNENDFYQFFEDQITEALIDDVAKKFMNKDLNGFSTIQINKQNISFIQVYYETESKKPSSIEGVISKNLLSSILKKPVSFKIYLRNDFFSNYATAKRFSSTKPSGIDYYRNIVRGMFKSPMKGDYSDYFNYFLLKMNSFLYNVTYSWN